MARFLLHSSNMISFPNPVRHILFCAVLLFYVFSGGCAHKPSPYVESGIKTITGFTWQLVELEGEPIQLPPASTPTLRFSDQDTRPVHGFGGCNRFSGNYLLVGSTVRLSQLVSTRMACPNLSLEQRYMAMLAKANRYATPDAHTLVLLFGDEPLAVFKR